MPAVKKIRVLIVDDSPLLREFIARGISEDPEIEVVARAGDPFEARDKILKFRPDVMTCDIQMPKMNGIEFIHRLIPQYPIPVVVVSSISEAVFDAMNAGAVDFAAKPATNTIASRQAFIDDLIVKIKAAMGAKVSGVRGARASIRNNYSTALLNSKRVIAIGASTGGTEAIYSVLKDLPKDIPPIVIVQHIPPVFSTMFAERMDKQLDLTIKEAKDGDYLASGQVLLAPGDMHMTVRKIGQKYKVECSPGEKVNGHCPSVDVLFNSVAKAIGKNAIGVILTGMGGDGAKGLLSMRQNGAKTLGQNEKTSVVYGMPKVAYTIGAVERQLGLNAIPGAILQILKDDSNKKTNPQKAIN